MDARRALFCRTCGSRLGEPAPQPEVEPPGTAEPADPAGAKPIGPDGAGVSPPPGPSDEGVPTVAEASGWTRTLTVVAVAATVLLLVAGVGVVAAYAGLRDRARAIDRAVELHHDRGIAHLARREYELAIAELELVLQLDPGHRGAADSLGVAHAALEARPSPTPVLREEINVSYYAELEEAHRDGDWVRALECADRLWSVDPTYRRDDVEVILYDAFYESGLALLTQERAEEAIRHFDRALSLRPDSAEAGHQRELAALYVDGTIYWGADWPRAIDALVALYARDADYLDVEERLQRAYMEYGDAQGRAGEWCSAAVQFAKAHGLTGTAEALRKQQLAEEECRLARQTAVAQTTATPGTRAPSGTFVGRVSEQAPLESDKIYIRGRVVDKEGNGVDGVGVEIRAYDWSVTHVSGGNGVFAFDGLNQPVTYTLRLTNYPCVPVEVPGEWGKITWVLFEEAG